LTHGAKVNFSGKLFRAVQYGIRPDTGEIDYEQVQKLAEEHKPRMIIAGFSAYSRIIDWRALPPLPRASGLTSSSIWRTWRPRRNRLLSEPRAARRRCDQHDS